MKRRVLSLQGWRWGVKFFLAATFFILPWIKVSGESALRFDVPTLKLYFLGKTLYLEDFFLLLLLTLAFTFLFLLITLAFGRIWCGWCCPQTVLCDFTEKLQKRKVLFYSVIFLLSLWVSLTLIWYFISPYEFWEKLFRGEPPGRLTTAFFILIFVPTFFNFLYWRRTFCAKICPYARAQTVLFDDKTLLIALDPERKEECINCKACVRACPVKIDIREGSGIACIACAECLSACDRVFLKKEKPGLIRYLWGSKKGLTLKEFFRPAIWITTLLFFLSLGGTIFYSFKINPVEIHLVRDLGFSTPKEARENTIGAFWLSLENKNKSPQKIKISTVPFLRVVPEEIVLASEEKKKVRLLVFVPKDIKKFEIKIYLNQKKLVKSENFEVL
ncbi:MAG: 4Fe-4S binding protein [Caldimicrobium sp.]|nr:4Fe-4S binding protein [Caldimicrobium sp.]